MKVGIIGFNIFSPGGTSRSNLNVTKEFNQEKVDVVIYNARPFSATDILTLRHQEKLSNRVTFQMIQEIGKDQTIDVYIITRETFFVLGQLIKHHCPNAMVIGEIHAPLSLLPENLAQDLYGLDWVRVATESIKKEFQTKYNYSSILVHHVSTHHLSLPESKLQNETSNLYVLSRFEDDVKDISYAIRLLDYLVHYCDAKHMKLYIEGYGPSEMLYRNLINDYGLHANVFFNQGTPVDYIYFSTSRYETFGYSIIEALAKGKRAILYPGEDGVLREIYGNPNNIQWISKDVQRDAMRILRFVDAVQKVNYRQALAVIANPRNYVALYEQALLQFKKQKQKNWKLLKSEEEIWGSILADQVERIPLIYKLYNSVKDKPIVGPLVTSAPVKKTVKSVFDFVQERKNNRKQSLEVQEDIFFIESFHGKSFSGDPKYIALWIKKNRPNAKIFVSSVNQLVDMEVRHFGMESVRLGSLRYQQMFRKSKYVIVNGNTLDKVGKSPNQIIIQTWHGLPLKKMVADLEDPKHRKQELTAFLPRMKKWDYLLSSSTFNTKLFTSAFALSENPELKILELGAPRNAYLIQNRSSYSEKSRIHMKYFNRPFNPEKKYILFCPTWRKQARDEITSVNLKELINLLPEEYEIIVKLHPLETKLRRFYKSLDARIHCFFNELVDIQELFLLADILISDYSSAIFDYAHLNKQIIILQEDSEKYAKKVGWYFDMKKTCHLEGKSYTTTTLANAILQHDSHVLSYCHAIQRRMLSNDSVTLNDILLHQLFS